jgi:hypothetical protein
MKLTTKRNCRSKQTRLLALVLGICCCIPAMASGQATPRVIEVLADHDSRYKIQGQSQPVITAKPGEALELRISAVKAKNRNRDGSVHGFTMLRASDRKPVPGWDFLLKPGTQEFDVIAPNEAGEYVVVCTVICSANHEQMNLKFVVEP